LILSLCLIKFHLFLLLPVLFLGRREWRLMSGFALGATSLLVVSFAAGLTWPQSYISLNLPAVNEDSRLMPNLHGLSAHFPRPVFVEFFLSLAVIALVWF